MSNLKKSDHSSVESTEGFNVDLEKKSSTTSSEAASSTNRFWNSIFFSTEGDLTDHNGADPVLNAKINLINQQIDDIGWTTYHLKLFCLNGLGYAVDSQLTFIQSNVAKYVRYQFDHPYPGDSHAMYVGLLAGAIVWGFGADLIGRKTAFNTSLILSSIFAILAGKMGNFWTYCLFVALCASASGGNLVLDSTVFLEFLPTKNQWLTTFMACWWGIGQTLGVASAWAFYRDDRFYCKSAEDCPDASNRGWRFIWFANGALVLILAVARLYVVKLEETPKYLVASGRDAEAVEILKEIAEKYEKPFTLTVTDLESCGIVAQIQPLEGEGQLKQVLRAIERNVKTLFSSTKMSLSTGLLFLNWTVLGIAYPMFSNFLPLLLESRGEGISDTTTAGIYRDALIANSLSIVGSCIGGLLLWFLGRKIVMVIGALTSAAFFFGYPHIKSHLQNVVLAGCVYLCLYIYFSCLYAYTSEIMPTSARGTGNAICIALKRVTGSFVPLIAWFADTTSTTPIYISGGCMTFIGLVTVLLPFEPSKQRVA